MNKMKHWILALIFASTIGGVAMTVATPQPASAACAQRILTFPAWYEGVVDGSCNIQSPDKVPGGLSGFIWSIALNVIELILQLVGYIAVGFIIYGGYMYMISAGAADGMVKARKIITNAIVGLVISIFSVAIVNLIAGAL